jgi:excisionase family DNA binding protein
MKILMPRWHTVKEVSQLLGFSLSKTKMLVITGEIKSLKDGRNRRIMPEWVDEYIQRRIEEAERGGTGAG